MLQKCSNNEQADCIFKRFNKTIICFTKHIFTLSVCPFCLAQSDLDPQISLSGNSGAVITSSSQLTASCQSDLITVPCDGGKVTVTAADVDSDNSVTANDALRILQYSVSKITSF